MTDRRTAISILEPKEESTQIEIEVELDGGRIEDVRRDFAALMADFSFLGAHGAFCVRAVLPSTSSAEARQIGETISTSRWVVDTRAVDPRAVRVIGNAMLAFSAAVYPLSRISIHPVGVAGPVEPSRVEPVTASSQFNVYPAASERLDFTVVREQPASFRHERRCLIEFASPLDDNVIDRVVEIAECWGRVAFGAYPVEEHQLITGDGAIFNVAAQQFDDWSVETLVGDFLGSEAAWVPLVNALGSIHVTLSPVLKVTIG